MVRYLPQNETLGGFQCEDPSFWITLSIVQRLTFSNHTNFAIDPSEPGHDNLWSCSSELRTPMMSSGTATMLQEVNGQVLLSTPKEDKVPWGVAEWRLLSTCFLAFGFMVFSLQMKLFSWGPVVSSWDHQESKLQMLNFSGPRLFKGFYSVGAFFSGMARHNCENKSNCQNWAQEAALDENSARRR